MIVYKVEISKQVTNGKDTWFYKSSTEKLIFQIFLEEKDFDYQGTLRKIVSGQMTEVVQ